MPASEYPKVAGHTALEYGPLSRLSDLTTILHLLMALAWSVTAEVGPCFQVKVSVQPWKPASYLAGSCYMMAPGL